MDKVFMALKWGIYIILLALNLSLVFAKEMQSPKYYWFYYVIDREKPVGASTTLIYDKSGYPNIGYRGLTRTVKFARFDGTNWIIYIVDPNGEGRVAMTFDQSDSPHFVYHTDGGTKVWHAQLIGDQWENQVVDTDLTPSSFYNNDIKVDSDGKAHIIYVQHYNGGDQISYAYIDGQNLNVRGRVDPNSSVISGKWSSLILDMQERPTVVYWRSVRSALAYAYLDQNIWQHEIIGFVEDGIEGFYPSIQQAKSDTFYVSFQSHGNSAKLKLAKGNSGNWTTENIVDLSGWGTFNTPSPLALDSEDKPFVAFYDMAKGDLKLAFNVANEWQIEEVDTVGTVGQWASLALTSEGMPSICYYDSSRGYLRLAVASLAPPLDSDNDNVPDYLEEEYGTGIMDIDSDDDGLSDGEEDLNHNGLVESYETDPNNSDTDGDGIQDGTEQGRTTGLSGEAGIAGTDLTIFIPDSDPSSTTKALIADSDSDGLIDGAEDRNSNGKVDSDESDPNNSDSDNDGLNDGIEIANASSPIDIDSDDDGIADNAEDKNLDGILSSDETSPSDADTDGDGIQDGTELGITTPVQDPDGAGHLLATNVDVFKPDADPSVTTDPRRPDTDGDGLKDGDEDKNRNGRFDAEETDPLKADTDEDGLKDGTEIASGLDPLDLDSDNDGLGDGMEDANHNGRVDGGELSPKKFDSDSDGLSDGLEVGLSVGISDPDGSGPLKGTDNTVFVADSDPATHTDPTIWDTDNDGLADGEEDANANGNKEGSETDPLDDDTDNDGFTDGDEVSFQTDPLDSSTNPNLQVRLREDFTQENLTAWTIVDEGTIEGPSLWTVYDTSLVQSSNIYGGLDYTGVDDPDKPGTYIWRGSATWLDSKISFKIRSDDNDGLGVMFRYSNSDNYYRFSMNREKQFARITRIHNGQATILDKQLFEYEVGRWYPVLIYAVDSRIQIYLDGKRMFDIQDDVLLNGAVAFYSWRNTGSWFSDLQVIGTDVAVSVQAEIHDFSYTSNDNQRIIKWIITQDSDVSAELERMGESGNFQRLLFQQRASDNFDKQFTFIDKKPWLAVGYRLTLRNSAGEIIDTKQLSLDGEVIKDFSLSPGFPNPFRSQSNVILQTPGSAQVRLRVYNILGQLIRSTATARVNTGWHQLSWDGRDDNNQRVPAGIYFLQVDVSEPGSAQITKTFLKKTVKIR